MAKNMIYKYDEKKTRVRTLAATVQAGTPLLDPTDSRPAVALTASGDSTQTITANLPLGWSSVTGVANGGAGLEGKETTLAYDGTWEFASITGVTNSTASGVQIYITSGGVLTNVSSGNTAYGRTDYPLDYKKATGVAPVRIGD